MADTFSKEERTKIMRQVKSSRNKSTELRLISYFKSNKIIGWRRGYKLFGKPDFTFPNKKIAIFVDGCFWHGHNCRNTKPTSNKHYWERKIQKNRQRDIKVFQFLTAKEWTVFRVWECELKRLNEKNKLILKLKTTK